MERSIGILALPELIRLASQLKNLSLLILIPPFMEIGPKTENKIDKKSTYTSTLLL